MDKVYKELFWNSTGVCGSLEAWVEFVVEFELENFEEIPPGYEDGDIDMDEYYSCIAQAMYDELYMYADLSKHIKTYMDTLQQYIV